MRGLSCLPLSYLFSLFPFSPIQFYLVGFTLVSVLYRFGFSGVSGLSDYLTRGTSLPSLLIRTNLKNLTILPGGRPPHNPSELLSSEKMPALLKEVTKEIVAFDATALAEEAGNPITTNVVMIGALTASGRLPFSEETVVRALKESLRPAYFEMNLRAFELGKKAYRNDAE